MDTFKNLQDIILDRRSVKPTLMNGQKAENEAIRNLLSLADWAPTHGRTEPWRFNVYTGEGLKTFCREHADLYKANTQQDLFLSSKYEGIIKQGELVSHLVLVYMKRQATKKIPLIEEIAATAAAVEHILLGAQSLGMVSLWSTGGMTHHDNMKKMLGLSEEDQVLGLIYLGYTDEPKTSGKRNIPLADKISWFE